MIYKVINVVERLKHPAILASLVLDHYSRSSFLLRLKSHDWFKPMQPSGTKSTPNTIQLRKLFATDSISSILGHLVSLIMRYNRISKIVVIFLKLMSQVFRAELLLDQMPCRVEWPNFCYKTRWYNQRKLNSLGFYKHIYKQILVSAILALVQ